MLNVNVKIITELKNFVSLIASDRSILRDYCMSDNDFTRTRKLPFDKLVVLIMQLCKKTLSVELDQFFGQMDMKHSCSVSAFVQQRLKLNPVFFYCWNQLLCALFYRHYGQSVHRWKGYKLIACDGSSISLVNTPCLFDYFGGQSNQHGDYVLAKIFYHYDVFNELIILPQIKPYRYTELNMAYDAIEYLPEDAIAIYDRNFSNYKMIALHLWQEKERKFIIRGKDSMNIIKQFIASSKSSAVVTISPTPAAIRSMRKCGYIITGATSLKVRLVRVELPTCIEVLITNLWEDEGHPADQFKELYALRWGVETNISLQKNIMQLESFSGLTTHAVLQDFFATVMTANLHAMLIKDAQSTIDKHGKQRKYPAKVNKNKSFGRLKSKLVSIFIRHDVQGILQLLHDHFVTEVIPVRKGRSFPRIRKNRQSKSKWRTFSNFKPAF